MAAAGNSFISSNQGYMGQGYPRELVDEKFISKDEFHKLEMEVEHLKNELNTNQLKSDNKTLTERLSNIRDLGKWGITTVIAIAALGFNIFNILFNH